MARDAGDVAEESLLRGEALTASWKARRGGLCWIVVELRCGRRGGLRLRVGVGPGRRRCMALGRGVTACSWFMEFCSCAALFWSRAAKLCRRPGASGRCSAGSYACEIRLRPGGPVLCTASGLTNEGAVGSKRGSAGGLARTAMTFLRGAREVLIDKMAPFSVEEPRRFGELAAICTNDNGMMGVIVNDRCVF